MVLDVSKGNLVIEVWKNGQQRQLRQLSLSLVVVSKGDEKRILSVIHVIDSERPRFLELFVFNHILGGKIQAVIVATSGIVSVPVDEDFCVGIVLGGRLIHADRQGVSEASIERPTATDHHIF